ncbi:MAG: hypothetical protein IID44_04240 [Planctomycetes bacterium]|nr:hypothetical protein [Planctomycetota bacterium]
MIRLMTMLAIVTNVALPALAQSPALDAFVGKNLQKLSEDEAATLSKMLGKKKEDPILKFFGPSPWHVWATTKAMPKRFLVFEGQRIFSIPGISSARIHVFDEAGKKLNEWAFSTGWRINLEGASFSYSDDLAAHLITIETSPVVLGRDVAKQYFAFDHGRLRFLRMEDAKGKILENDYAHPNHTLGIMPEAKSRADWIKLLESKKKVDVLSALTFLGGRHLDPPRENPREHLEKIEQAKLVKELRSDQRVGKMVRQHLRSDSKWIKEAAAIAANTLRNK